MANTLAAERGIHQEMHPGRRDYRTARWIYRSQTVHHAFGRTAARLFMWAAQIAPALAERVLSARQEELRR